MRAAAQEEARRRTGEGRRGLVEEMLTRCEVHATRAVVCCVGRAVPCQFTYVLLRSPSMPGKTTRSTGADYHLKGTQGRTLCACWGGVMGRDFVRSDQKSGQFTTCPQVALQKRTAFLDLQLLVPFAVHAPHVAGGPALQRANASGRNPHSLAPRRSLRAASAAVNLLPHPPTRVPLHPLIVRTPRPDLHRTTG